MSSFCSSAISSILAKSLVTSLPLSEKYLEKRLCALTSIRCPSLNLQSAVALLPCHVMMLCHVRDCCQAAVVKYS